MPVRPLLATGLALALSAEAAPAQQQEQQPGWDHRPIVLTQEQFRCLVRHRDKLRIGRRGTVFSLKDCEPRRVRGSFPLSPSANHILLRPGDRECLAQVSTRGQRVAFRRRDGHIALYLQPCGYDE